MTKFILLTISFVREHNHFNEKERKKGPDNTESEWRMWTLIFNNKNSSRPLDAFKTECGI